MKKIIDYLKKKLENAKAMFKKDYDKGFDDAHKD